jgi:hypothetical protein
MTDASHVRNAIARFDQVDDVSDEDRDLAFANIKKAAKHYRVDVSESTWRELGKPRSSRKKGPAPKSVATRKKSSTRQKTSPRKKGTTGKKSLTRKKVSTRRKAPATRKKAAPRKKAARKGRR